VAEETLLEEFALAQFSIIVSPKFSYKFDTPQNFHQNFLLQSANPTNSHKNLQAERERESVSNGSNSRN
jgi:hypothetical protein